LVFKHNVEHRDACTVADWTPLGAKVEYRAEKFHLHIEEQMYAACSSLGVPSMEGMEGVTIRKPGILRLTTKLEIKFRIAQVINY
jgi:hypothetical protein